MAEWKIISISLKYENNRYHKNYENNNFMIIKLIIFISQSRNN